jgi:hypothetical protein
LPESALWPANVVLLLSCQSPSLNGIGLYYIDVHDLTTRLEAAAREFNPAYNASLSGSERLLPTYWHFGISGKPPNPLFKALLLVYILAKECIGPDNLCRRYEKGYAIFLTQRAKSIVVAPFVQTLIS